MTSSGEVERAAVLSIPPHLWLPTSAAHLRRPPQPRISATAEAFKGAHIYLWMRQDVDPRCDPTEAHYAVVVVGSEVRVAKRGVLGAVCG